QKQLAEVRTGQNVTLTLDAFKGKAFTGTVNAISPKVDADTRNVQVEARVPNPDRVLSPGMFVNVNVNVGTQQRYLTLPQTAGIYNPSGARVHVITTKPESDKAEAAAAVENNRAPDARPAKPKAKKGPQEP